MSLLKKFVITIFSSILLFLLITVVFKPLCSNLLVVTAKKTVKGQYVCTVNNNGKHEGRLYKYVKGRKVLQKKFEGETCIFSKPKLHAGFFVLLIGGGGGATPYEKGNDAQIVSKFKHIKDSVIVINVGKGGSGTYFDGNKLIDAKDGQASAIKTLHMAAKGGNKSTRMTPIGKIKVEKKSEYVLPEKYRYLYDLPASSKYGRGAIVNKTTKNKTVKAQNGENGIVIIQW